MYTYDVWMYFIEPFQADIVTSPPGVPVDKDNNTFGYLIGSNLSLTCSVTPIIPANLDSSFSWNCSTGCFADMRMEQTFNVTDLDTMDNGSITCSFTFDNVDYHSDPLNLLVSGELSVVYTYVATVVHKDYCIYVSKIL